jgi:hypothetical protein
MTCQNSSTCTLVADFIVYLESHLLPACIVRWGPSSKGQKKWHEITFEARHRKVPQNLKYTLDHQSLGSSQNPQESIVTVGL